MYILFSLSYTKLYQSLLLEYFNILYILQEMEDVTSGETGSVKAEH